MLKIIKRRKIFYLRGTVRGVFISETTGVGDKETAEQIRCAREQEIVHRSVYGAPTETPFLEVALRYMERVSPTQQVYVDKLIDYFRATPIQKIGQREAEACAKALYPNVKPQTVLRACAGPLQAVLNDAEGFVEGYRPPRLKKVRWRGDQPRTAWLNPGQVHELLRHCDAPLQALVLLMLTSGCRPGEALKLRREDVRAGAVTFWDTKNGTHRVSPVPEYVSTQLWEIAGPEWVFPWHDRWAFGKAFQRVRIAAGLPPEYTPHTLCHTFATWMRHYAGADARILLETGRWKDARVLQRYMHIPQEEMQERLAKLPLQFLEKKVS